MSYFDRLDFGDKSLYSDSFFSGDFEHKLYLVRSNDDGSGKPKFYIWVTTMINGVEIK